MRNSIKAKIIAGNVSVAVLMLMFMAIPGYIIRKHYLPNIQKEKMEFYAATSAEYLGSRIIDYKNIFQKISTAEPIEIYSKKGDNSVLLEYFTKFQDLIPVISFVEPDGTEDFRLDNGQRKFELGNISDNQFFQEALRRPGEVINSLIIGENDEPTLRYFFFYKKSSDEPIGIITSEIPLSLFTDKLNELKIGKKGITFLVDQKGDIIFHPEEDLITKGLKDESHNAKSLIAEIGDRDKGFTRATIMGEDEFVAFYPVKNSDWSVIVVLPYKEYISDFNTLRFIILGIFLFIGVIGVLGAINLGNRLTKRIEKLLNSTEKIAKGDLSLKVEIESQDELGRLASSFNSMVEDLNASKNELINAKEYTDNIFRNIKESLIVVTPEYRIKMVNPAVSELFGYTESEMIDKPLVMLFKETGGRETYLEDGMGDSIPIDSLYTGAETVGFSKDGRGIPVQYFSSVLRDEGGLIRDIIYIIQDLSSRKQYELNLEQQREWLEVTLSSIESGVIAVNTTGTITFINPVAERLTEWAKGEALGKNIKEVLSIIDAESVQKTEIYVDQVLRQGVRADRNDELFLISRNNRKIPIEERGAPIKQKDGKVLGVIFLIYDITKRKESESEQQKMQEQIRQAQKMESVGVLAGGIAHDLNSLLGVIIGYGYMLKKRASMDSSAMEFIEELLIAGGRAKDLIKRLNTFSQPSSENKVILSLNKLLQDSIKLLRPTLPASIKILLEGEKRDISIVGDEIQFYQVITNLFLNASDAMEDERGTISISTRLVKINRDTALIHNVREGDYARIRIEDDGHGIAPQNIGKIFDPFFTTKEIGKGTGLGLSVVYGIMKSNKGFVTVESFDGKGTIFDLYFPEISR